eukprot:365907-Chlamydomonas_euryale.AAC.11
MPAARGAHQVPATKGFVREKVPRSEHDAHHQHSEYNKLKQAPTLGRVRSEASWEAARDVHRRPQALRFVQRQEHKVAAGLYAVPVGRGRGLCLVNWKEKQAGIKKSAE